MMRAPSGQCPAAAPTMLVVNVTRNGSGCNSSCMVSLGRSAGGLVVMLGQQRNHARLIAGKRVRVCR